MWRKHLASGGVAPERQPIESTVTTHKINGFGVRSPIETESRQAADGERSPVSGGVWPASMWFSPLQTSKCSFGGRDSACERTPGTALLMRVLPGRVSRSWVFRAALDERMQSYVALGRTDRVRLAGSPCQHPT